MFLMASMTNQELIDILKNTFDSAADQLILDLSAKPAHLPATEDDIELSEEFI